MYILDVVAVDSAEGRFQDGFCSFHACRRIFGIGMFSRMLQSISIGNSCFAVSLNLFWIGCMSVRVTDYWTVVARGDTGLIHGLGFRSKPHWKDLHGLRLLSDCTLDETWHETSEHGVL